MNADAPNHTDSNIDNLLRAGIAAARAGQREGARELLTRVIEQDERNLSAWLWLSGVVDDLEEQEICLENVLSIDPDHVAAKQGLTRIREQQVDVWLRDGIMAARAGQRARATELLGRVVEQDERNAQAWMWLSSVVDKLEDREICLENILTLDPDNDKARRMLVLVQEQLNYRPTSTPTAPSPFTSPLTHEQAKREREEEVPEALAAPPAEPTFALSQDEFADETLCPYCAAKTQPKHQKCPACGGQLWVKSRQQEQQSPRMRVALTLQMGCTLLNTIFLILLLAYVSFRVDTHDLVALARLYLGLSSDIPPNVASTVFETVPRSTFLILAFFLLLSLVVLVGLFLRWKPIFYLVLINGAGLMAAGAIVGVSLWEAIAWGGEIITVVARVTMIVLGASLALVIVGLAMELRHDFFFEQRRMYLRVDSDAVGGMALLTRGREYGKRGMWALAAVHLRQAVKWLPNDIDAYLALAIAYIQLERYELAAKPLAEARSLNPDHPQVEKLSAYVAKMAPQPS